MQLAYVPSLRADMICLVCSRQLFPWNQRFGTGGWVSMAVVFIPMRDLDLGLCSVCGHIIISYISKLLL